MKEIVIIGEAAAKYVNMLSMTFKNVIIETDISTVVGVSQPDLVIVIGDMNAASSLLATGIPTAFIGDNKDKDGFVFDLRPPVMAEHLIAVVQNL